MTGIDLWDLIVVALMTGALAVFQTPALERGPASLLVPPLAIAVVLLFPGYVVSIALFPGASQLIWVERLTLSLVLSLVHVVLLGLALYFAHVPINGHTFLALLAAALSLWLLIGGWRRLVLPAGQGFVPWRPDGFQAPSSPASFLTGLSLIALILVGLAAVVHAAYFRAPGESYTVLALQNPATGRADLPLTVRVPGTYTMAVSIANHEHKERSYWVLISLDDKTIESVQLRLLKDGAMWRHVVRVAIDTPRAQHLLQTRLYLSRKTGPYRELHLWLREARGR